MANSILNRTVRLLFLTAVAAITVCILRAKPDNKLTPADLVARHLESIGSAEARARMHGTTIKGNCMLTVREGGTGQAEGQALMASQAQMNLIKMTFNSEDPPTWFKFDGTKAAVSQFRPGRRTSLEHFFVTYDVIVKEGLLGGVLSESWPLLNLQVKNPKLEYAGIKKIGGKELHALKYTPRKGSDLKITIFFDEEGRHVRTAYEQTIYSSDQQRIAGGGGALPTISSRRSTNARVDAVEEFSDFKSENDLKLPHTYKFQLSIQSEVRPALIDWVFNLTDFRFNAPLDASEFTGDASVKEKP